MDQKNIIFCNKYKLVIHVERLYSSLCGTDLVKFEGLARNIGYVEGLSAVSAVLIAGIRGPLRFFLRSYEVLSGSLRFGPQGTSI